MLLGVDVGGTFTDAVLAVAAVEDREGRYRVFTAKAPTTPRDESEGVIAAVQAVLERAGRSPQDVEAFSHGMTVATNALLEGRGARTALVATEGFTDIVALGRQNRAELYRLCAARPASLVPPELRFAAPERMTPEGPLRALSAGQARELARHIADSGAESVAVVLLHSYRHPEHELAIGAALAGAAPGIHVSLSHEVVGTFREFERAATTEVDAALSPLLAHYIWKLVERCGEAALPEPAIMQSNGGLIDAWAAAGHAAWTVLSGPAAGAAGAAFVARAAGAPDALCFDMGGTSCDVCVVDGGAVQEQGSVEIGGRPLSLPALAVHTVGAGGGSIAWCDPGGALRVGPRSAGADPGPACYGRGGTEPTVTDAHLGLGHLPTDAPLAGGVSLDLEAARAAIAALASELGLTPPDCAAGIIRVANAELARALRVVTVMRGIDPRRYALLAFGGAGPLHAAAIAHELGIETILCPRACGVLAALGLVVAPRRRDVQRSVLLSGDTLTARAVATAVGQLGEEARRALRATGRPDAAGATGATGASQTTETAGASQTTETAGATQTAGATEATEAGQVTLRATYELRYRGQGFELAIGPFDAGTPPSPDELRSAFEAEHQERYGYTDPEQALELVTIRVSATVPGSELGLDLGADGEGDDGGGGDATGPTRSRRNAVLDGAEVELEVLRGAPPPGTSVCGPMVVELAESTLLVPVGWSGEVDVTGTICLRARR